MASTRQFALPDLGEGLTESELIEWHVVVGDLVELNQPIAEVETAKAIVQLPSPFAGVVSELYVEAGSTVSVGAPIMSFEVAEDAAVERNPVLVGYGPPVEGGARPTRKRASHKPVEPSSPVEQPLPVELVETPVSTSSTSAGDETPRSTPPVRKLAHDLGVDLSTIAGTGDDGTITRADVQAAVSTPVTSDARETRIPIKGVRKHTAEAMVRSAFTAPHVTEFLTIDVTPTTELLAELRDSRQFAGQRLTMLSVVAKALCIAVARTPSVNTRWDEAAGEIVQFGYVNLGIAVATPRGLMVPNIPDADAMSLSELAGAIADLATIARNGETTPRSLSGGTISITNVGVFGVDAGTPILNPGEAAILALGAVRRLPWNFHDTIALRDVLTLSLSFDHRLVDGEQGSTFLTDVGAILANPGRVLTMI
jgi:2-oxoisovalerate dehydrogenase E2 component (dihydrolipoyl transacylase)